MPEALAPFTLAVLLRRLSAGDRAATRVSPGASAAALLEAAVEAEAASGSAREAAGGASAAALLEAAVEAEAASGSAREAAGGTADVSAADSSATSACLETQVVVNWLETWLENHQRCGKIIEQTLMGECPICISNTRLEHRAG